MTERDVRRYCRNVLRPVQSFDHPGSPWIWERMISGSRQMHQLGGPLFETLRIRGHMRGRLRFNWYGQAMAYKTESRAWRAVIDAMRRLT